MNWNEFVKKYLTWIAAIALLFLVVFGPLFLVVLVLYAMFILFLRGMRMVADKNTEKGIVFIIISVLVFGIICGVLLYLMPEGRSTEVCTMPAGMTCSKFYLQSGTATSSATTPCTSADSCANVTLVNGLQKTIVIMAISLSKNTNQYDDCFANDIRCPGYDATADGVIVPLGSSIKSFLPATDESGNPMAFIGGDDFSGKISVEYYFKDEGPLAKRKLSGNVYARAT